MHTTAARDPRGRKEWDNSQQVYRDNWAINIYIQTKASILSAIMPVSVGYDETKSTIVMTASLPKVFPRG